MITATIEQLTDYLNLTPGQVILAKLFEELQAEQAIYDSLPKKSERQIFVEAGLKILDAFDFTVDQILIEKLHSQGRTQREISKELGISLGRVNKYLKNVTP